MRRALHIAGSLLLLISATSILCAQTDATDSTKTTVGEQYLFSAANAERTQRGLKPLRWDVDLYQAADAHAREMASRRSISHQYPGEPDLTARVRSTGARFSVVAENVAEAPTAIEVHGAWMASPGHRANILDPRVNAVGIRVVRRDGQLYAVEDFSHTVEHLSIEEQEGTLRRTLETASSITLIPASEDAHQTCTMETGYAGKRMPWFVMRYTTDELNELPGTLRSKLADKQYHQAEVAACEVNGNASFSTYRVAILLYP